jgi:hypothetical protein
VGKPVGISSEQGEREGEGFDELSRVAPSGFDRPALGGLQTMCGGGDVSPYNNHDHFKVARGSGQDAASRSNRGGSLAGT